MASIQGKKSSSLETIWVLGCGQFGRRAIELLRKASPASKIVVVDRMPVHDLPQNIEILCSDGVDWFVEHFNPDAKVTKIVPALPLHLVAEWIRAKLLNEHKIVRSVEISDKQLYHFPHPIRLGSDRIAMSYADSRCPPNCSEPAALCTYIQRRRVPSMYSLLHAIILENFTPLIVRSRQFAPGVGGFFPEDLWNLLDRARKSPGIPLLIGTACKYHAVVDGILHTTSDIPVSLDPQKKED